MFRVNLEAAKALVKRKAKAYAVEVIRQAARAGAAYAKANHPYQDRTGELTRSIQSIATADGAYLTARAKNKRGQQYGGPVEYGHAKARPYPYLRPAAEYVMKILRGKQALPGSTFEKT